jgi:hypothetical protein
MSYDEHRGGPARTVAALVAVGAIGGRRSHRLLRALQRFAGWTAVLSVPMAVLLGLALPDQFAAVFALLSLVYGVLAVIFWCYTKFAIWLTKPYEEDAIDRP